MRVKGAPGRVGFAILAVALGFGVSATKAQQNVPPPPNPNAPAPSPNAGSGHNGPSLGETLGFIAEKVNAENAGIKVTSGPGSCTFTFEQTFPNQTDPYWEESVELKDIYKAATSSGTEYTSISLFARGGLFKEHPVLSDRLRKSLGKKAAAAWPDKTSDYAFIPFRDASMADRVAAAIVHAVELCEPPEKPEPF